MPWIGFTPESIEGLPTGIVKALSILEKKEKKADVSVTTLITPPQVAHLRLRHDYLSDADEMLWAMFGKALHHVAEQGMGEDERGEETLYLDVEGTKVEGTPDLWSGEELLDLKSTSVWSAKYDPGGVKHEWVEQLNIYAHLLRKNDQPITSAKVVVIYRDWRAVELKRYPDWYPHKRLTVKPVPLWDDKDTEAFLRERVLMWQASEKLSDEDLARHYPCSDEDTWQGRRCAKYCPGAAHCHQYQEEIP